MSKKIKVAAVGIGNCFSSLYQGLEYYKDHDEDATGHPIPGVMFSRIGGYHPADIQIVAAFDVDRRKVGRPTGEEFLLIPIVLEFSAKMFQMVQLFKWVR